MIKLHLAVTVKSFKETALTPEEISILTKTI